jgi:hypothetical protein
MHCQILIKLSSKAHPLSMSSRLKQMLRNIRKDCLMLSPYIKTSASAAEFESMLEPLMWLPQASSQLQFYALGIEGRPQHW